MELCCIEGWWYPEDTKLVRKNKASCDGLHEVLQFVQDWSIAVDGGAYVGGWAKPLAASFETVYAIEISPRNSLCLELNCPENVKIVNACLGEKMDEEVGFEGDKKPESPIKCVVPGIGSQTITIDSLNLPSCGLIKLDLQGYDTFALYGAEQTLRKFHPVVVYEHDRACFERYGLRGYEASDFLMSLGFERTGVGRDPIWTWNL